MVIHALCAATCCVVKLILSFLAVADLLILSALSEDDKPFT